MAAAGRHADVVEIGMREESSQSVLTASRVAVDSHPVDVIIGIFGGHGLVPENPVRQASIVEVLPKNIMEGFGPVVGAHAVNLDDDESHLGQRLHAIAGTECFEYTGSLRPGIDGFHDRVLFFGIEIHGPVDYSPDVGLAVTALGDENLGRFPA